MGVEVGAGDKLHEHLLPSARRLRAELGANQPLVLGFDRGDSTSRRSRHSMERISLCGLVQRR